MDWAGLWILVLRGRAGHTVHVHSNQQKQHIKVTTLCLYVTRQGRGRGDGGGRRETLAWPNGTTVPRVILRLTIQLEEF